MMDEKSDNRADETNRVDNNSDGIGSAKSGERAEKNTDNKKKQVPLRLSASLWQELAAWAEDDFRSINGQIEYLLTECVKRRRGKALNVSE